MTESDSPDIDQGWALVIMVSCCLAANLSLGLSHAAGVLYSTFLDEFGESPSFTSLVVNLSAFTTLFAGEFCNIVFGLVGHRLAVVIGCLISTFGLGACYFANSLAWILVMYGIVTGPGFAIAYFSTFPMISLYFKKFRVLAFSVTASGISLGMFIYAPLCQALTDAFHWRGTFLILAGINLNLLVVAATYMPPRTLEDSKSDCDEERVPISIQVKEQLHARIKSLRLFLQPRWTLFCIAYFLSLVGYSGFYTHVTRYAEVLGYTKTSAALLVSGSGISGGCTRLIYGIIAQHPRVHVVGFFTILLILFGISIMISGFMTSYIGLLICMCLNGALNSSHCFFGEVVIHIIGIRDVSAGASYGCIFAAAGRLLGGPIGGWIYEADSSYRLAFIAFGLIVSVGSMMYVPSWLVFSKGKLKERPSFDEMEGK